MQEEFLNYLKEHLRIEFYSYKCCGDDYLGIKLIFDGEVISSDESFVKIR